MPQVKQLLIISGRSGAGKSTAAKELEDLGFLVVDNFPPQLFFELLNVANQGQKNSEKIAAVVDAREPKFLHCLPEALEKLSKNVESISLLFLDSSNEKLITRFQESKRKHPLDDGCGVRVALEKETKFLQKIEAIAQIKIHTDNYNSHELRKKIRDEFENSANQKFKLNLVSFGFKNEIPKELDICLDVRFIKNPYYDEKLKNLSGHDQEVYDFVLKQEGVNIFLDKTSELLNFLIPQYQHEGKSNLTIAIGCTGGRHRSVSLVRALEKRLAKKFGPIRVEHRDLERHT